VKIVLKNPISIWLLFYIRKKMYELKYRKSNLKIGYMTNVQNCKFGKFNTIGDHATLINIEMGDFSYTANSYLQNMKIGKYCSIAPYVRCGYGSHPSHTFVSTHPIFYSLQKQSQITFVKKECFIENRTTIIENDVWIGLNSILIDGITIHNGAMVAAGSVVNKDIPPYAIVGGVPAKIIRYRFAQNEIDYLNDYKWWEKDIEWLRSNCDKMKNIETIMKIK
jgi:acetyltransferase-like isoleucine patch superfamily enzyme